MDRRHALATALALALTGGAATVAGAATGAYPLFGLGPHEASAAPVTTVAAAVPESPITTLPAPTEVPPAAPVTDLAVVVPEASVPDTRPTPSGAAPVTPPLAPRRPAATTAVATPVAAPAAAPASAPAPTPPPPTPAPPAPTAPPVAATPAPVATSDDHDQPTPTAVVSTAGSADTHQHDDGEDD